MKSSFLANISHELRTPLAPILGYAQIMRRKKVPARQRDQFLEEIVSSSKRLERVVSILVDVAALEAGHLEVSPRPADPADLVRGAAARWKERLKDRDVRSTVSRGLPEVHVDEVLVGRALDEIVDNAVKFSPDGGPVTIRARKVAGGVEVSVTDKGIGISADDIERLQGEFVQADPSETRRFGGLGVGLSFVRRILEAHDASLQVAGRPGRGTTVSFVLPVHAKPGARAAKRSTAKPRRRRS